MTIGQRIKLLIFTLKHNNRSFGQKISFSDVAIGKVVRELNGPSLDMLHAIYKAFPNVNPKWVEHEEGDMFLTPGPEAPVKSKPKEQDYLQKYLTELEAKFSQAFERQERIIEQQKFLIESMQSQMQFMQANQLPGKQLVNEKEAAGNMVVMWKKDLSVNSLVNTGSNFGLLA